MRKVLALRLLTTLMVLSLLSTASFVVPVHAQEQYSISTDKLVYNVGETVTIYVSPAPPNFGVYPWIVVTKPDQSQVRLDLELAGLGQATTRLVADIVGQYTVDLWFQAVGPNATPRLMATCYFQAGGNQTLKFQPTIQERLAAFSVSIAITIVVIVAALWLTRKRRERVSILGRFVRFLGIGVIAYVIGGIAYWTAGELFPRRPPQEIVVNPLISFVLDLRFWPMMVYADLEWVGVTPQDVAAVSAVVVAIVAICLLWIKTSSRDRRKQKGASTASER